MTLVECMATAMMEECAGQLPEDIATELALAALKAMREPTLAMCRASNAIDADWTDSEATWLAMIDAAIAEAEEG